MPALLLYLLRANGALLLFAALYYVGLRRLTFYGLNRAYLLFALLFSALCPVLDVPALFAPQVRLSGPLLTVVPNWSGSLTKSAAPDLDWGAILVAGYWVGVAIMGGRLLLRLGSLYRLHRASVPATVAGQAVRCLPGERTPFSFGSVIYLNPAHYPAAELPAILHHERVHVRQGHTLDVLLAQVGQVLGWFNPAAWWLGRAVPQNLEFLTDAAVLRAGLVSPKAYQYSLLRLSGLAARTGLANHFTFLTLKTRIAMMNKPVSARTQLLRYALVLPLAVMLLATCTSRTELPAAPNLPRTLRYYLDGQLVAPAAVEAVNATPDSIASMNIIKEKKVTLALTRDAAATGVVVVTTKRNQDLPAVQALDQKITNLVANSPAKPTEEKTIPISNLPPAALAYITQHFPDHRLIELLEIKGTSPSEGQYKAVIAQGRRPQYVVFDPQGKALGSFDAAGKPLE